MAKCYNEVTKNRVLSRHVACQNKQSLSSYYQVLQSQKACKHEKEEHANKTRQPCLVRSSDIRSLWGAMQAQTPERCQVQSNHLGNAGAGTGQLERLIARLRLKVTGIGVPQ